VAKLQTNIRLEEHVRDILKRKAEAEGRTFVDILREYIARGLREDGVTAEAPALKTVSE